MEGTSESKEKLQSPTTMDNDRLAAETAVKIEVVEVKQEVPEMMESESFGVDPSTVALPIKEEDCKNSDRIDINRIKNEPVEAENWGECAVKEEPGLDLTDEELEEEMNQDYRVFIKDESTSEYIVGPDEQDSTVIDEILKKQPVASERARELFRCSGCTFTVSNKNRFIIHVREHKHGSNSYVEHSEVKIRKEELKKCIHVHCNAKLKTKKGMDHHILQKHPDLIASISCKIHQCTYCTYKTSYKDELVKHNVRRHPETIDSYKLRSYQSKLKPFGCIHCYARFKLKRGLDNHISKKHMKEDTSKKHIEHKNATRYKLNIICQHCNAPFQHLLSMYDHILNKHPGFSATVAYKIHECTHCSYKTANKTYLTDHLRTHSETFNSNG
ncbi:unnamed protein product [Acanthoscelides obtectus]|uniref:C2H2-type domain-containing protein n=1 Tax=Acanthoscelides obtectus TaxID=200917 RepID=A0A9P0LVM4_ACAOB|nr:unnamed protein product [Acanthoscelides obtectus]CAK1634039.1 hypothetical protein AOBTE_LOCUS8559 [Acanthoscelides obtectus]